MIRTIILLTGAILLAIPGWAQVESIASGNWSDPATWFGGNIPTPTSTVNIVDGHEIILDQSAEIAFLNLTDINGGSLLFGATGNFVLTINNNVNLFNNVLIGIDQDDVIQSHQLVINGNIFYGGGEVDLVDGSGNVELVLGGNTNSNVLSGVMMNPLWDVAKIVINKGSAINVVNFNQFATLLPGANTVLEVQNGLLDFDGVYPGEYMVTGTQELYFSLEIAGSLQLTSGAVLTVTDTVNLTLTETATVSFESNSYIEGSVGKRTNSMDTFTFPVGATISGNPVARPISISPTSTANTLWTAEYFDTPQAFGTDKDNTITTISTLEYWDLSHSPATPAVVGLSWDANSMVTDPNDQIVIHWNGAQWDNFGGTAITGNATSGSVTSQLAITSFSPITLGTGGSPLPVELASFEAGLTQDQVQLEWTTATELNNEFFQIQRSNDGFNFENIGKVEGAGSVTTRQHYEFVDQTPLLGQSFYRLKQVDYDGTFAFSPIRSVSNDYFSVSVFPNPSTDFVRIQSRELPLTEATIQLYDLQGREVTIRPAALADEEATFGLGHIATGGTYLMNIGYGDRNYRTKLIILD